MQLNHISGHHPMISPTKKQPFNKLIQPDSLFGRSESYCGISSSSGDVKTHKPKKNKKRTAPLNNRTNTQNPPDYKFQTVVVAMAN